MRALLAAGACRGPLLRELPQRRRAPRGRLGPLAVGLPRLPVTLLRDSRNGPDHCAAAVTAMGAAVPFRAAPHAPVPCPTRAPPPSSALAAGPRCRAAGQPRRRSTPPPRDGLSARRPMAQAEAGEGAEGWAGAHCHVGPGCQPPLFSFCFPFSIVILAESLVICRKMQKNPKNAK